MNEKDLLKLKNDLQERKKDLEEKIKKLEFPVDFGDDVEGNEDMSEEADEAEEYGANVATADFYKKELEGVVEALAKIEKGEYGESEGHDCCGHDH